MCMDEKEGNMKNKLEDKGIKSTLYHSAVCLFLTDYNLFEPMLLLKMKRW